MAVRAKMRCTGRREFTQGGHSAAVEGVEVMFQPVFGVEPDDKANAEWSKWTPSGELKLSITTAAAYEQFKIGKSYFVDITAEE